MSINSKIHLVFTVDQNLKFAWVLATTHRLMLLSCS